MSLAIKRVLNAAGFRTETFASAEDLLRSGAAAHAACLVIDVRLSGSSGFELVTQLAERRSCVPFIFLSAHQEPDHRQQAANLGAIAYLPKPFEARNLIEAVNRALSSFEYEHI